MALQHASELDTVPGVGGALVVDLFNAGLKAERGAQRWLADGHSLIALDHDRLLEIGPTGRLRAIPAHFPAVPITIEGLDRAAS